MIYLVNLWHELRKKKIANPKIRPPYFAAAADPQVIVIIIVVVVP